MAAFLNKNLSNILIFSNLRMLLDCKTIKGKSTKYSILVLRDLKVAKKTRV